MRVSPVRSTAVLLALVLTGCGTAAPPAAPPACDPGPAARSTVEHAENFSLTYAGDHQVLTVHEPAPGAPPESYVLLRCGADPDLPPERWVEARHHMQRLYRRHKRRILVPPLRRAVGG